MSGHATGDGMDGILDDRAPLFQHLAEIANGMLSLRDRHSVTWNKDDSLGGFQDQCDVFGRGAAYIRIDFVGISDGTTGIHHTEQDIHDRAIHRFAHQLRQDHARGSDQRTGND